jgi:hypothetical protein
MNLTDLSAELQAQAASTDPTAGITRLTGVRHRIRLRRRRQVATVAGLAAAGVAAIVLVPGLSGSGVRADSIAPASRPSDPLAFRPAESGDPLIASVVGKPGEGEVVLWITPTTGNLALSDFCRAPEENGVQAEYITTVNGHEMTSSDCGPDDEPNQGSVSGGEAGAENAASWARRGLIPGRESVIKIKIKMNKPGAAIPDSVRLGLGLYELSAPRVTSDGVAIQTLYDIEDHSYRLAGYRTAKTTAKVHSLTIDVPPGRYPAKVLFGLDVPPDAPEAGGDSGFRLYADGKEAGSIHSDGGGSGIGDLKGPGAHSAEVRVTPDVSGTMVIAYYERID